MWQFAKVASSASSSVCGLAGNLLALGLDDLTLWPAEWCDGRNMLLHFVFFDFCCGPSGSLEYRKNDCHFVPNGKVHDAHVFGPCVLAATASSWCWRALEAVTAPWSVQPNRYGDEDTTRVWWPRPTSLSVQELTRKLARYSANLPKRTFHGTRVQRHLVHQ